MGYYDKNGVPVYDYLATQFAVCDRWFASIPTDTFPNRLYAMTGGSGGLLTTPSDASVATNPPAYVLKTIFEVLQEHSVDWNIFFSDLPFALVFTALAQDAQYTARMRPISEFLNRAATGELPAMAWIDPNFNDVPDGTDNASDDHPPGDVQRGQQFVEQIFNALVASPAWSKTMLIITYDEHGGFFDHVEPPGTPPRNDGPKDDDPNLTRYGLRVPSIVVSPWVAQGQVAHTVSDHTSTLRTILLRFCATPREVATDGTDRRVSLGGGLGLGPVVPSMGARTDNANDLGGLLSLGAPRAVAPFGQPTAALAKGMVSHSPLTGIGATIRRGGTPASNAPHTTGEAPPSSMLIAAPGAVTAWASSTAPRLSFAARMQSGSRAVRASWAISSVTSSTVSVLPSGASRQGRLNNRKGGGKPAAKCAIDRCLRRYAWGLHRTVPRSGRHRRKSGAAHRLHSPTLGPAGHALPPVGHLQVPTIPSDRRRWQSCRRKRCEADTLRRSARVCWT